MGPVLEAPWGGLLGRSWDYDTGQTCNNLGGLGKGLWKELFVLLRSELRIYTP